MENNKPMVLAILLGFTLCLSLEDAMLRLVNEYRGNRNMDTLYCLEALQKAAEYQARVMCTTGKLTHEGIDKYHHALDDRLRILDFVGENIGENIAKQENDEYSDVFKLWISSSEHRKNILGDYTYTGVSTCKNKSGYRFWVQVFGKDISNSFIRTLRFREIGSFGGKSMDGECRNPRCPLVDQEYRGNTGTQKNSEFSDGHLSVCDGTGGCRRYDMGSSVSARSADAGTGRASEFVQSCRDKSSECAQNTGKNTNGFFIDESTRRNLQEQVTRIVVDILQTGIVQGLRFFGQRDMYGSASEQADGLHLRGDTNARKKGVLEDVDMQFSQRQQERSLGEDIYNKKKNAKENTPKEDNKETVQVDKSKKNANENGNGGMFRDYYSNDANRATNSGESHLQTSDVPQQTQGEGQAHMTQGLDPSALDQSEQNVSRATNSNSGEREKQPQNCGQSQNSGMEKCAVDKFCKKIDIGIPLYLGAQWTEKR